MGRDIYATKRTYHIRCKFYKVDRENKDNNELLYKTQPSGVFYAKKVSAQSLQSSELGGVFRVDETNVTIKVLDDVKTLQNDDKVVMDNGTVWFVVTKQTTDIDKEEEFSKRGREITYIQLRK